MTLREALALARQNPHASHRRKMILACGFQPLHLIPLLKAHYAQRFPDQAIDIETGLYGDIEGTLAMGAGSQSDAAAAVIEWSDLDSRLGLRSTGGWDVSAQGDIISTCRDRLARMLVHLRTLAAKMPVALIPPTLRSPLFGHTGSWQASCNELDLQKHFGCFFAEASKIDRVYVLNVERLADFSPEASRLDASMELKAGFPYTIPHASALACYVMKLLFPPTPMKGLITDLDDTLWSGIVGEVGVRGVCWSLAEQAQVHGLYQQMLRHLSAIGVLLAVASKNELTVVEEALRRNDLLVPAQSLFPVCANWGPKSHSIAQILRIWNIAADSVVFVDDSAMELDEVRAEFPALTCLQFPGGQPGKVLEFLEQLRDLFGKPVVHHEDGLRQSSIRANAAIQASAAESSSDVFVRGLRGTVTFDSRPDPANKRLLELINKTNQFNLNGVRLSEGEWLRKVCDTNGLVVGVSYEDKFGPLGVIGVLAGHYEDDEFKLAAWVLSCRAFSRKIEHHMLDYLFKKGRVSAVRLSFRPTSRNQPLQNYLTKLGVDVSGIDEPLVSREQFQSQLEELPHEVRFVDGA